MDLPIRLDTREAILLLTLVGIGVGILFGLVPLIYGRIRGKTKLGVIGFVVSIVAGAIWSVLPLLVMITFVFLILRNPEPATPPVVAPSDESDIS
jgi:hypothetical protein